jgi:hypothetical protein
MLRLATEPNPCGNPVASSNQQHDYVKGLAQWPRPDLQAFQRSISSWKWADQLTLPPLEINIEGIRLVWILIGADEGGDCGMSC